ncbi:MAG: hypothetical protein VKJ02_05960, partial [Snowella sp.]|nr:hypothetical protein [Snowella sp.]
MTAFARITDEHDALAFSISPCAGFLYRFLLRLRPAGQAIEFEIEDFNQYARQHRPRPFCHKWVKIAIYQLEAIGLIQILKKFNARCLKLVALHPQLFSGNENSIVRQENSKKEPSKADSVVPIHREYREKYKQPVVVLKNGSTNTEKSANTEVIGLTNLEMVCESKNAVASLEVICENQTLDVVNLITPISLEEEKFSAPPQKNSTEELQKPEVFTISEDDNTKVLKEKNFSALSTNDNTELLEKAEDCGVRLNPFVIALIAKTEAQVVANAIAALKEARRKGNVKNPTGYLVKAIQQKWHPMEAKDSSSGYPHGFLEWYQKVVALGLVENIPANYLSCDLRGEPFVRLPIQDGSRPYLLKPW